MVQPVSDTVNTTAAIVRFGTSCPALDNCVYWVLGTGYWVPQNFEGKSLIVKQFAFQLFLGSSLP